VGRAAPVAWSLACPDWADRIRAGRSLLPELPLFKAEADRAVAILDRLRFPDVPGQPMLRDAAGPWFRDSVRALFGSYDAKAKERHVRELFVLVPKKNSKTSNGAALMLTAMLSSERPRAEFLLIAPTIEIADLAFRQVVGMIDADKVLSAKCHIQEHIKRISYRPTGAFLKVKSFDPKVVTGTKPAGVLLDELHVIAESHDADRVIGQLRGGLISQPEGFLVTITTQSERPPSGVFRSELLKARMVRDGKLTAPILPVLYEFPPDVDWRDPANWHMVTPNEGRSVSVKRLIPDFHQAESAGDAELRRWASQHLNIEIGLALQSDRWVGADFWEQQGTKLSLDDLIARSEVITVGIDGGGLDDLLGLCVLGREKVTGNWLHWAHAWAHPSVLERRKSEAARFRDFEKDGDLTIVEKIGDDVDQVAEKVKRVQDAGLLNRVGVDPAGIASTVDALHDAGIDKDPKGQDIIVGISQGWKLVGAIKTTERKLAEGVLHHGGAAMMAWCLGNAKVEPKGNAIIITKQASGSAKIDPLMATFNAVTLMSLNPQPPAPIKFQLFFA
jgi:phage terminase large subunit-like protein